MKRASRIAVLCAVFAQILLVGVACVQADDWPTYRHDVARSGVTPEDLPMPLSECWVFTPRHGPDAAWPPPKPKPVEGILELRRMHFDDTFHVVAVGDALYFGSSSENKVCCLDMTTGKIRWTKRLGGPVRLAPMVWKDRLFVGCDDGYAYCLQASDGSEVWRFHAAPHDEKLLGNGKMISLWPMRTGVLVDDDVAYFTAGIFPMEGVYVYAVNAEDATVVWKNDTCGETHQTHISPQGYMLASKETLFVPMARVSPAAFDRKTGRLIHTSYFGKTVGGTYALLADGRVFTGTREMMAYDQKTRARFAWYPGRQLIVTPDRSYMLNATQMLALDRTTYPELSLKRSNLVNQEARINSPLYVARKRCNKLKAQNRQYEEGIASLRKQIAALTEQGKKAEAAKLEKQSTKLAAQVAANKKALDAAEEETAQLGERRKAIREELKTADEAMASCFQWQCPCDCAEAMILAGHTLFAGGENKVVAVDSATGRRLWTAKVDGRARGLAVASGRLFVSTEKGTIHCFGPDNAQKVGAVTEATTEPYPKDDLTPVFEAAADQIVRATGITRGYCLMLGSSTGRLACELAKRTDLQIYGIEPDAKKAEASRQALDAAGLFGSRVCIDTYAYDKIPYADYFADLIVSESALVSAELPGNAKEAFRMLKPLGGTICIGQPDAAKGKVKPLSKSAALDWPAKSGLSPVESDAPGGMWLTCTRGALEGAGRWTQQYANPGNTACSDDQLVKCPLGILWFGRPGPTKIVNRHRRAASPLAINGRLFVQGEDVIMAFDAYNGLAVWEREIEGARREVVSNGCSNLAVDADSLFVAVKNRCLRLDQATGKTEQTYTLPVKEGDKKSTWGSVTCFNHMLYGTRAESLTFCDCVFAMDPAGGKVRWTYEGKQISQAGISFGDGKVFLTDRNVTPEARSQALKDRLARMESLTGVERIRAEQELKGADVRMAVALDATTGKTLWARPVDFTGACGGAYWQALASMYNNGVLIYFGIYTDGHYWKDFFAGEFKDRRVIALAADSGKTLWTEKIGYRVRPLIIGDTFHAEPWAYDLKTGKQKMRIHPVTGRPDPWQYARPGHHCGCPAAAPHTMVFRSGSFGYYDLDKDYGTMHFGSQRPACWINFIPACGVLLFPEGSAGCMCPFPNQCSYAFKHRTLNRAWAQFSAVGPMTPVKHLAINLGAPGDRKDEDGTLWLGFPRAGGSLVLRFNIKVRGMRGSGFVKHNSDTIRIDNTDSPWIYASGHYGPHRIVVPLLSDEDGDMIYTVRFAFADWDNEKPGVRVFDIKLQDKVVCKGFDLTKEAGGKNRAIIKEFKGIQAQDKLKIEFVPAVKNPNRTQMPVLQGFEVVREKVLGVGCAVPSFLVNDEQPEQTAEVRMANNTDSDFAGTLEVTAPDGFTVTAKPSKIRLPSGERTTVALTAALAKRMPRGTYDAAIKLVRSDGTTECERTAPIEHLANRGRMVVKAVEDAHVGKSYPGSARGTTTTLNIDGGQAAMADESHHIAYLKFRLDVPGKPVSAMLRLYNAGNPTGDSGHICLVTSPWSERKTTYNTRPELGKELAKIGPVVENQVVELPLQIDLSGMKEISLAIDPTGCDGVNYISREGGKPAELVVEYEK